MTWQDRHREPAPGPKPRLRPNVFARLARFCFRHGLIVIAIWVALAIPALVFTVTAMKVQLREAVLVAADSAIAEEQSRLEAEFPEPSESIVAVIDSKDPKLARSGAERMAARMGEQTNVFRNIFAPGTGRFFDDSGVLYLNEEGVANMVARIERSGPLFQALSISPNLTGIAVLADQVARVVAEGRSPEVVTALLSDAAKSVQAQIAGQRRDLDWLALVEHGVTIESPRWYVLAYPLANGSSDPARRAVEEARRLADLTETEFGGRIAVQLTGRPVLRALAPPPDIRALLLPSLLSGIVILVILAFGLSRFGSVMIVLATVAITFIMTTALALVALGAFDRVSLTYPVLFAGLIGVAVICWLLRAEEAEQSGLGRLAAAMLTAQALGLPLLVWLAGITATGLAVIGSPFLGLQKLAVVLAIMSAVIGAAAMTLLPAFLSLLRPHFLADVDEDDQLHWLDKVMARPASYGWWSLRRGLAATLIAVAVLCGLLVPSLHFESPVTMAPGGDSAAERLFRELSAREPSLLASGQILAEPGDPARLLVRRLATLPEVEGVRWVESFLPPGEAEKRAILARLQGVFPRNTTAVPDVADDPLRAEFVKLLDALQRIAAEPKATPELAGAANELRRSLLLLENNGVAPPDALRQLERTFFTRLQLLLDRIDRLSHLDPLTVDRLDPAIHRQFVSRSGLWRIEVQPRRPDEIASFASAVRSVAPSAAGAALVAADRLATMRAAVPVYVGAWALLIVFLPLILFLNLRKAMRILLPVATATLLALGATAMMGASLNPESIAVFALLMSFTLGAAILAEAWYGAQPNGQWPQASSRPRALLLSAFLVLAALAPLMLSPLPAVEQFGILLLVAMGLSLVGLFVLLPQLRVWTAPRRRRRDDDEE